MLWLLTVTLLVTRSTASTPSQSWKSKTQKLIWEKMKNRVGNYLFLQEEEQMRTSYFHDPSLNSKFLHLTYRKNFQNSTSSLNSFLNNLYPLNSLEVKNKEAETYLNYTTENYLRYKMETKKKEEEGKESAAKKGEEEERKKGKEGRKEKK